MISGLALFGCASCPAQSEGATFATAEALDHEWSGTWSGEHLPSTAPHRITGTPEADAARAWIVKHLTDLGLAPVEEAFAYRVPGAVSRFATLLNAWMMPLLDHRIAPTGSSASAKSAQSAASFCN